jgi:branched-chain amino acid transport system substrate-binding protein
MNSVPKTKAKISLAAKTGLMLPLAVAAAFQTAQAADNDPIRIGLIYSKQGSNAIVGKAVVEGTLIAGDQIGNKVLGRPVEFIWLDEPNPQGAQQNMQKLIEENKVVAVMGSALSSSALAMEALAKRRQIPLFITQAAASEITGKECNRYTFRVSPTAAVHTKLVTPFMDKIGKKWYTVTPAYAFGQDALKNAKQEATRVGATILGSDEIANNTTDYSSYILKIRQAKPDVVFTALAGDDLSNFLKQWSELGMKGKATVVGIAVSDMSFWEIGPEISTGVYNKPWYFADPKNPPVEKQFAADYEKKYKHPPTEKSWMGWYSTRALLQVIANGKATDAKTIVTGLEGWKDTMNGLSIRYRDFDHQLVRPALSVQIKPKITDKYDYFDIVDRGPATQADLEKIYGTKEETGCVMGSF